MKVAPRFALLLLAAGALAGAACTTTLRVRSDYDHGAAFTGFHSFAWLRPVNAGRGNPLIAQRARDALQASLTAKGFTYASDPSAADFTVDLTIGARDRVDTRSYPAPYAGPWGWYGPGWWGYPYWGNTLEVREYREGTLAIDIFDARSHRPVWHGWARKELQRSDLEHSAERIREAVDAVLATFPPA